MSDLEIVVNRFKNNTRRSSFLGYMQIGIFALVSGTLILLIFLCLIIYQQVRYLTTANRNQNIGTFNNFAYQDVSLTTSDGLTISGWYVPGTKSEAIIIVHGIHANRAYLVPQAEILAKAGYHLLLIDLRGHGYSEGEAMTFGYREALDVRAAVDYLADLPEVEQIGALGHSLGAAAVVRAAAADDRLKALVIQSSYSSLPNAIDSSFNDFAILPKWPFAPLIVTFAEYITGVDVGQVNSARDLATMSNRPILIIHSTDDNLFSPHHAEEMYRVAKEPKDIWLVEGSGHINPIVGHEAEYEERLLRFFENAFAR